jgi:hypothetical protein
MAKDRGSGRCSCLYCAAGEGNLLQRMGPARAGQAEVNMQPFCAAGWEFAARAARAQAFNARSTLAQASDVGRKPPRAAVSSPARNP